MPHTFLTLQDVTGALRRHWRTGMAVGSAILMGAVLLLLVSPSVYVSEAKLFVRIGRESVSLDPTATTGERVTVYESRESEINSVLDILESRALLETVLGDVGVEVVLNRPVRSARDHSTALDLLAKAIYTNHNSKSSVISVACEARSPELAQQILTSYLQAFRDMYVTAHRTSGSLEFFEEETESSRLRFLAAQQQLAEARKRLELSSFEGRMTELQMRKSALEEALAANERELALTSSRTTAIRQRIGELQHRMLANDTSTNSAYDQTRGELYRLRVRREEMLVKFTPIHPLVREIDRQIESAESILAEHPRASSSESTGPVRQELELVVLHDEALIESLQAQHAELQSQLAATALELRNLIDARAEIEDLELQVEQHRKNLLAATDRLEEARIDRDLAVSKISNVNPVQPPTLETEPVAPRKRLVLGLGLLAALFAGVASALLCDLFISRPREERHPVSMPESTSLAGVPS